MGQVTMAGILGTALDVMRYDGVKITPPDIAYLQNGQLQNAALSGEVSVTIAGWSFLNEDMTPSALLGVSFCSTVSWISVTTLNCLIEEGYSGTHGDPQSPVACH